jgi:hypothetical protein
MAPYHVSRAREQLGVFSREEVLGKLNRGELLPADLAWTEGMADWQPLGTLFPPSLGTPPPVPTPVDPVLSMLIPINRSGWAIAAGYLALGSVLCVPAPIALFCGIMALRDLKRHPHLQGAGRAWFGIIMGSLGTVLLLLACAGFAIEELTR